MNLLLVVLIFAAQGLVLGIDEKFFHHRRELPRWERWGHPLDTLSVLLCLAVTLLFPAQSPWTGIYFGLAVISCLCVTKDEWVHSTVCPPAENWLHALLFLLHPALLWAIYSLWERQGDLARFILKAETLLCALVLAYQFIYWNFVWRPRKA
jgi:hypothetical protein